MDVQRIMSITALVVAIATCAFAFLMYRRVSQRLDSLSLAHLTLSRTLQHMVSASMPEQNSHTSSEALDAVLVPKIETDQKNIIFNDELSVRRIPVSDDEKSEGETEQSDDDEEDNGSDGDSESRESTPLLRSLTLVNLMETDNLLEPQDDTLLTLELVPSENEDGNNVSDEQDDARIVEMENDSDLSDDNESDMDLEDDDEDGEDDERHEDFDKNQTQNQLPIRSTSEEQSQQSSSVAEIDEIVALTSSTHNYSYQTDLKLQKVETLRKMALEKNLADEESLKKMKKSQLVSMLGAQ